MFNVIREVRSIHPNFREAQRKETRMPSVRHLFLVLGSTTMREMDTKSYADMHGIEESGTVTHEDVVTSESDDERIELEISRGGLSWCRLDWRQH